MYMCQKNDNNENKNPIGNGQNFAGHKRSFDGRIFGTQLTNVLNNNNNLDISMAKYRNSDQMKKMRLDDSHCLNNSTHCIHSTQIQQNNTIVYDSDCHMKNQEECHCFVKQNQSDVLAISNSDNLKNKEKKSEKKFKNEIAQWDKDDVDSDLHVVDYVDDIIKFLRIEENKSKKIGDYMKQQTNIKPSMRNLLVDWLINVHKKFNCMQSTLFLTVNLLDRFLAIVRIDKKHLQLVGCCCLWIASKYHEIYAPEPNDFVVIAENNFTLKHLIEMETSILIALNFDLCVPTTLSFAERYSKIACFHLIQHNQINEYNIILSLISYLTEIALIDYDYCVKLDIKPSLICCSAIAYAILGTNVFSEWPSFLEKETQYKIEDLIPMMKRFDELITNTTLQSIKRKYSSPSNQRVSSINFSKFQHRKFY